jgi:hypothetical protein
MNIVVGLILLLSPAAVFGSSGSAWFYVDLNNNDQFDPASEPKAQVTIYDSLTPSGTVTVYYTVYSQRDDCSTVWGPWYRNEDGHKHVGAGVWTKIVHNGPRDGSDTDCNIDWFFAPNQCTWLELMEKMDDETTSASDYVGEHESSGDPGSSRKLL